MFIYFIFTTILSGRSRYSPHSAGENWGPGVYSKLGRDTARIESHSTESRCCYSNNVSPQSGLSTLNHRKKVQCNCHSYNWFGFLKPRTMLPVKASKLGEPTDYKIEGCYSFYMKKNSFKLSGLHKTMLSFYFKMIFTSLFNNLTWLIKELASTW